MPAAAAGYPCSMSELTELRDEMLDSLVADLELAGCTAAASKGRETGARPS